MSRDARPARMTVRLAPALYTALKQSAHAAGCSLNAYAVQVLAAAAGHHARFRGTAETGPTKDEQAHELRELARDDQGRPLDLRERRRHLAARAGYREHLEREREDWPYVMLDIERECSWHFVEWDELNAPLLPDGLRRADRRAAG